MRSKLHGWYCCQWSGGAGMSSKQGASVGVSSIADVVQVYVVDVPSDV